MARKSFPEVAIVVVLALSACTVVGPATPAPPTPWDVPSWTPPFTPAPSPATPTAAPTGSISGWVSQDVCEWDRMVVVTEGCVFDGNSGYRADGQRGPNEQPLASARV